MSNQQLTRRVSDLFNSLDIEIPPETITRYVSVLELIAEGSRENIDDITKGIFPEDYKGVIIEKQIPIFSYCEHHVLPWFGVAHIGYLSEDRVLGLSKFTRIVNHFSAGLTLQERVTSSIANFVEEHVSLNVIVSIEALHTCKVARGVQNPFSRSITIDARGVFIDNQGPRSEFLESIRKD